jgi:hypothetical protein
MRDGCSPVTGRPASPNGAVERTTSSAHRLDRIPSSGYPELPRQEIRCLLQCAQPYGFLPHILLWRKQFPAPAPREYAIVLGDSFYTATVHPTVLARAPVDLGWTAMVLDLIHAEGWDRSSPSTSRRGPG